METVRPAAVAGLFYPDASGRLERDVAALLTTPPAGDATPRALIAPHAGYIYSGPAAGAAYARLRGASTAIRRVILLGPSHRVPLGGIAASGADAFETPLGLVRLDRDSIAGLVDDGLVAIDEHAHAPEHSLEVHLPFLQVVLDDFELVPLLVGECPAAAVEAVITRWWDAPDTLVVVSTDLSHYHPYEEARRIDAATDLCIRRCEYEAIGPFEACGCRPLAGLLRLARRRGAAIERIALCNSGDTAGAHDRVVGYGSYALT